MALRVKGCLVRFGLVWFGFLLCFVAKTKAGSSLGPMVDPHA